MSKFEKKFGKYAIHNLTMVLIMCYVAGYVIELMGKAAGNNLLGFLTLDPYRILHGQVWRLVTWVIVPPESLDIFTIICCFSIIVWVRRWSVPGELIAIMCISFPACCLRLSEASCAWVWHI